MPNPTPVWLLDKNVVRRAIEGIGTLLVAAPLTAEQSLAIRLLRRGKRANIPLRITPETANILARRSNIREVYLAQHGNARAGIVTCTSGLTRMGD